MTEKHETISPGRTNISASRRYVIADRRHPAEDKHVCPLCYRCDFRLLHHWGVPSVWLCACGLVFRHPGNFRDENTPAPRESLPDTINKPCDAPKRLEPPKWHQPGCMPIQHFIQATRQVVSSGKLLDISCGNGDLLQVASHHYECVGVEESPVSIEAHKAGFTILTGRIEELEMSPCSYQVVTLYSALERSADPIQVLRIIHRILATDGVLAIQTVKYGSVRCRLQGNRWKGYSEKNLYLFSSHTLTRAMEVAGFEVLSSPRKASILGDTLASWGRKSQVADYETQSEAEQVPRSTSSVLAGKRVWI